MGKEKGNGGEREVAKQLAEWWHEREVGGEPVLFVRTPLSGGWAYGAAFKARGDLMTNAPSFPFSVEVKREQAWALEVLMKGQPSPVWKWWRQCQRDARATNSEPMLWFRQNRRPWLVMMRADYVQSKFRCIPKPFAEWDRDLRYRVDCQEHPMLYLGSDVLQFDPETFART